MSLLDQRCGPQERVAVLAGCSRALAQEWTYRFLGAALAEVAGSDASFAGTSPGSPSEAIQKSDPESADSRT